MSSPATHQQVDDTGGGPPLLQVEGLTKAYAGHSPFKRREREVLAVDNVSFAIERGQSFGLVGESGCGKSTIARCLLRLIEPTSGRILFDGDDLATIANRELRLLRRRIQIVFQDPYSSLDPRMTVDALLEEPLIIHGISDRRIRQDRVREMLEIVGLNADHGTRKPHAFSGGQRQRISLARALILRPDFVVLDEPVSALDVSIQAQILNLLASLQQELQLTYLFIAHDLAVAEYFCDSVAVLYRGSIMEEAETDGLFRAPLHPYSVSLLSAVPVPRVDRTRRRSRIVLPEVHEALEAAPGGCPFRARCPVGHDREVCADLRPPLVPSANRHLVACHFPGELRPSADLIGS